MDGQIFNRFCEIAHRVAGIQLGEGKEALVIARVTKRMRTLQLPTFQRYLHHLETDRSGEEMVHFLDSITTNFTSFYRERDHFEHLYDLIQRRLDSGIRRLRLWSAASSSGEEPYSMAITLADAVSGRDVDYRILGTDISTQMLSHASSGVYNGEALKDLTRRQLDQYFTRQRDGQLYRVREALRRRVVFKRLNLSRPPFPMPGPLDAIFCRNVMIYFDQPVRQRLVFEMERLLAPDGVLYIGHCETLTGLQTKLRTISPSIYCHR